MRVHFEELEKIDSDTKHAYYKSIDDITKRIFDLKTLSNSVINCEKNYRFKT